MGSTSSVVVGPPIHFLNVEYFFRLIYDAVFSIQSVANVSSGSFSSLADLASTIWLFVTLIAYVLVLVLIGMLVYFSTRLYQTVDEDAKRYTTLQPEVAHAEVERSRWTYIRELIESPQQSDWRQAIIEADIMLDEMLSKLGFEGASVGDKLKTANEDHFHTLNEAWTAHRVRNDIAHQGSTYELTDHVAYRTINQYENVFREFKEI